MSVSSQASVLQPLHRRIRDTIVGRIVQQAWRPGEALPSEHALAAELGASQGTVRKVLNELTAESLLTRRHGKGTFVAEHSRESALFRFFRVARPDGRRVVPEHWGGTATARPARRREREKLELGPRSRIIEISRTRLVDGAPAVRELIILPADLFPGFERRGAPPNALYSLFQAEYGVNIVTAQEQISAEISNSDDVRELNVEPGSAILSIDRLAISLEGLKVEWRVSRFSTENLIYAVDLR